MSHRARPIFFLSHVFKACVLHFSIITDMNEIACENLQPPNQRLGLGCSESLAGRRPRHRQCRSRLEMSERRGPLLPALGEQVHSALVAAADMDVEHERRTAGPGGDGISPLRG